MEEDDEDMAEGEEEDIVVIEGRRLLHNLQVRSPQ
jgi:hypothetical protein